MTMSIYIWLMKNFNLTDANVRECSLCNCRHSNRPRDSIHSNAAGVGSHISDSLNHPCECDSSILKKQHAYHGSSGRVSTVGVLEYVM